MNLDNLTLEQKREIAKGTCSHEHGFEGLYTFTACGKCIICICRKETGYDELNGKFVKTKKEGKRDLKQWRKDSDNFKGSSKDRDKLFKELEKQKDIETKQEVKEYDNEDEIKCLYCGYKIGDKK